MGDQHVGGLWCHEVLELLPDFVEGELDLPAAQRLGAHIQRCDQCARFGGAYASVVRRLRQSAEMEPLAPSVSERLADRLQRELA